MVRSKLLLPGLLCVLAAACGSPKEGDTCDQNGFLCVDQTAAIECKAGAWVKLPCRGPSGCERVNDIIRCDTTLNALGDACASISEGKGLCNATGTGVLVCQQGKFEQTHTCRSCAVSGEQVVCQP